MSKNKIHTNEISSSTDEGTKLAKIVVIILIIFAILYFVTGYVSKYMNKKNQNTTNNTEKAVIQYDEIMIGELLNQNDSEYYVLLINQDDPYYSLYNTQLTAYKNKGDHLSVYTVSLASSFNQKYISDSENLKPDNIADFRIKEKALLKISNKKITESYTGDEILNHLKEIAK